MKAGTCSNTSSIAAQQHPDLRGLLRYEGIRHAPVPVPASRFADLVGELALKSGEFFIWWNDHRDRRRTHGAKSYHRPLVGDLHFSYESFPAPGESDQTLWVYNVDPGSETAPSLPLLGNWTAPQRDTLPRPDPTIAPEATP
ncbi:hypothetical protein ACIRL2_30840 [Embleya sp. NPDC127516]